MRVLKCHDVATEVIELSTDVMLLESVSPGRDLDAYIQTINALPILTPERERELAERFFDDDDLPRPLPDLDDLPLLSGV